MQQQISGIVPCEMGLSEYIQYCCSGRLPQSWLRAAQQSERVADILSAFAVIGGLEPLCATRPNACEPRLIVDRDIFVPPASIVDGKIVPTEARAIAICAPLNKPLVVDELRITAANLTAATQSTTNPEYKRVNLATFGEWCLPFEPLNDPGLFANVEHIMVPAQAGFAVYVRNDDPFSEAVYHLHGEMWACS